MSKKQKLPIRIVIADDHQIFREGFKLLLNNQPELLLVGEADNGKSLLKLIEETLPDIAFVDIKMPEMDGIEACKIIKTQMFETKVIALTMFNEDYLIIEMLEAGAYGYLLKNTNRDELLNAAKAVQEGKNYYCSSTSNKLVKLIATNRFHPHRQLKANKLSVRETEILKMVCEQMTNKEIGEKLGISNRTVESYRETLLQKTASKNAIGLVVYAIRNGIFKI
ncbi:MAG: LuxR family transcriptional regulator [Chitinophagaceae bacterium]|nr:MAG: LuxR family transcriptional [Chitinophagaceae bacterium]TXT34272.1 MAG: LuxR family transcriptional regulator [Chitinophagaceae bacterium]